MPFIDISHEGEIGPKSQSTTIPLMSKVWHFIDALGNGSAGMIRQIETR
jgi:hypothetical protein